MTPRTWRGRVFVGTSVDGKIAREDGTLDWLTDPPAHHHDVDSTNEHPALVWETFIESIDAIVMGRATYDSVIAFSEWPFDGVHVIVLTTRSTIVDARVRTAASIEDAIRHLDGLGVHDVYIDGGRTIQAFLRAGLVDELTISVAPVVLGSGRSLFAELDGDLRLAVRGSHATRDGLVRTTYDVVRA